MAVKSAILCAECAVRGTKQLATHVYVPEERLLTGPAMGQPDYAPHNLGDDHGLCDDCYAWLAADEKLTYERVPEDIDEL
ncbi:MAG TPA: hypothetical protein VGK19_08035 [Capsulimonadaceae bacterium]|jgi:hypothetical protein